MAVIITFSGSDGAGKTTLGKVLKLELETRGHRVQYRTEFNYFLLKYLIRFLELLTSRKKVAKSRQDFLAHKEERLTHKILPYLVFLDLLLEMAYVKIFLRGYVIMDRHVNDFIIGWRLIRISNSFIEKLFLKFPDPDFSFTLYVDPAKAYQRKKDEQNNDLEFFKKLHHWSLELGRKRNHYLMDTGKPLKQCLEEVLDVLLTTNRQAGTESMNSATKRT